LPVGVDTIEQYFRAIRPGKGWFWRW
jgi:hypothetical protein